MVAVRGCTGQATSVSFQSEAPIGQSEYGDLESSGAPSPGGLSQRRGVAPLPPMRPGSSGTFMGRDSWGGPGGGGGAGGGNGNGAETSVASADQSHGTYVV
jgi:hypothetical protein